MWEHQRLPWKVISGGEGSGVYKSTDGGEREITIAKVNTDVNPLTSGRFGIRGIPALILFRNGEMVDRMTGAVPKQSMDSWLDRHMS